MLESFSYFDQNYGVRRLLFLRFCVEILLNFFDVHVFNNRLEVLNLQGLTSNR
jgi:hypothetical protein